MAAADRAHDGDDRSAELRGGRAEGRWTGCEATAETESEGVARAREMRATSSASWASALTR